MIIGLTGPIASGKSTVAKYLARRGAVVIDADKIGHDVIQPQSKAWHGIVRAFGIKVLKKGGGINRRKLAALVFSDRAQLQKLNGITHPEMRTAIKKIIKRSRKKKLIVINAAILKEMSLIPLVDKVFVVLSRKKNRIKRLTRSGLTKKQAAARISSQQSDSAYRKSADLVLINDGSLDELAGRVKKAMSSI